MGALIMILRNGTPRSELFWAEIPNPIQMYARRVEIEVPAVDKPIVFDTSWDTYRVAPYGKGKQSDSL